MRLSGEISQGRGEKRGKEEEREEMESVSMQPPLVVALTSKKKNSFLQPKFQLLARDNGVLFIAIDQNKPLDDQEPFDIVLHKVLGNDWYKVIEHPEVTVIDPPHAIRHLQNRQSMLEYVADLNLSDSYVCIPRQLVIHRDPSSIALEVSKAGLKLPLVAKPLMVDGSVKSHELRLAYDHSSLSELEPPLVLQEFVNHGNSQIYIIGEAIKVVRRLSLPNVSSRELAKVAGVMPFPRVSCASASAEGADLDPSVAEHPPRPLLQRLAEELHRKLGLRLFNIDMIREHETKDNRS